jgi:hypothetical protein
MSSSSLRLSPNYLGSATLVLNFHSSRFPTSPTHTPTEPPISPLFWSSSFSFPFNIHFHNNSYSVYFLSSCPLSTLHQYYLSHIRFLFYLLLSLYLYYYIMYYTIIYYHKTQYLYKNVHSNRYQIFINIYYAHLYDCILVSNIFNKSVTK